MKLYFAPLEGIATQIYRRAFHECFSGIDKFYTPFLSPSEHCTIHPKEKREVLPENNAGMETVPQILTNKTEYFIRTAHELKEAYGYEEVNLNLGCPSGTVVSKGKGAGFLGDLEGLDAFFAQVFAKAEVKVSVKTRVGISSPEEFYRILEVYNRYPLQELIVHPRVRKDFYKNKPDWGIFAEAVRRSGNPLCYNGDIFTLADYVKFRKEFPTVGKVMLGRGLLVNPALAQQAREWERQAEAKAKGAAYVPAFYPLDKEKARSFHDCLFEAYREELSGDTNLLFKMKELWSYMACLFTNYEKYWKKIKKASRLCEYGEAVNRLFAEQELRKWELPALREGEE